MSKSNITFKTGNNNHKTVIDFVLPGIINNGHVLKVDKRQDPNNKNKITIKKVYLPSGDVINTSGLKIREMHDFLNNISNGMNAYDAYIECLSCEEDKKNALSYEHKNIKYDCEQFVKAASNDMGLVVEFINEMIKYIASDVVVFKGMKYTWLEVKTIYIGLQKLNNVTINKNLERFKNSYNEFVRVA